MFYTVRTILENICYNLQTATFQMIVINSYMKLSNGKQFSYIWFYFISGGVMVS